MYFPESGVELLIETALTHSLDTVMCKTCAGFPATISMENIKAMHFERFKVKSLWPIIFPTLNNTGENES